MPTPLHHQYNIRKRQLPSCSPCKSKNSTSTGIVKQFTRKELEDAASSRRKDSTRLRAMLAVQKQREASLRRGGSSDNADASGQMRSLDVGVKLCARKYNDAKAQADKLEDEVRSRTDDLAGLERESKALSEMLEGNNSDARTISRLSAEIQETNDSSDRVLLYRHQLNFMKQRVRKNSVTMDCHMEEMSDALSSAEKEREWRKKMLAEVESGLSCASLELEETIQDTKIAEERRNRELMALQSEADDAARMEEWNRQRMNTNLALHESFRDTDKEEREQLQKTMRERKAQLQALHKTLEENAVKLRNVDECITHIKDATGVNTLKEMIMKISQHDANQRRLVKEKKEAEDRLRKVKLSLSNDQDSLQELKTSGVGDIQWNRDVIDGIHASIADEKAEVKIAYSANEKLQDLLVGIRQGSNGLFNRLLPFHSTLFIGEDAPKMGKIDLTNATQAASDTLEMIQFVEKVLNKILLDIGGIQMVPKVDDAGNNDVSSRPTTPGQDVNCRIISPKAAAAAVAIGEKNAEVDDDDDMIDTPSRRSIKSQSIKQTTEMTRDQAASYTSPSRVEIMARVDSILQQKPELD